MGLDCSEMIPGSLWVGTYVRPGEIGSLVEKSITAVLSLQSDNDLAYCALSESKVARGLGAAGISYQRVPVEDFSPEELARRLPECIAALRYALAPEGACVYLHCTAGINRAPTVAAAYLIRERGLAARIAYDYVRKRRSCSPYLRVLEEFEENARGERPEPGRQGS